jgi:acetate---CoA ligase (ADP-forming)
MTDPHRAKIDALFGARSVALIGASDKSMFSKIVFGLQSDFGAADRTYLINPNKPTVHGRSAFARCQDVPGGFDCAYVMVPRPLVPDAVNDAAEAGASSVVVLSGGYAETDEEGIQAQADLVAQCEKLGLALLGPNHLGFANVVGGTALCALPGISPRPGPVALVSQSGALAGTFTLYSRRHGIRFSYAVTTGNEAMITTEDVLDYVVEDERTRSIAVFAEAIRKPDVFLRAARKAAALGKPIVMLKAGSSELSARTAAAHTGALVGDDAVVDAVLRQEGVIRVGHMEELLITAHLAAETGRWPRPGAAVTSLSGGACDVIADRGEEVGLPLPELAPETEERLSGVISALGHAQNPLDVTGAAMMDPELMGRVVNVLADDPSVGFMLVSGGEESLPSVGAAMADKKIKAAFAPTVAQEPQQTTLDTLESLGLFYLPSLRDAIVAMAHVSKWSSRPIASGSLASDAPAEISLDGVQVGKPVSEMQVRELLRQAGVPVVPVTLVQDEEAAVEAARQAEGPVALKIVSAGIEHKSDIGGVQLNCSGDDEVRKAFRTVRDSAKSLDPTPEVDGVLVAPMRSGGTELLVGVARDPSWGLILAVALGGVFVEILHEARLLRLPATREQISAAIGDLRGAEVLHGARGRQGADLDRLAEVVERVADLATALGPRLQALEINPLYVKGDQIEALDGLINWTAS